MHKASTIALIATLTACVAEVDYHSPESEDDGTPLPVATTDRLDTPAPEPTETATGSEPDGPPCDGHAQCWPDGWCTPGGECAPQDADHCIVGGDMTSCGPGEVCCDFGEKRDCALIDDCDPTPP